MRLAMDAHGGYWFSKATAIVQLALVIVLFMPSAGSVKHIVGGSVWSIPPSRNFYNNWSTAQSFHIGDVLYFDFESEMYSVHEVGWYEYDYCQPDPWITKLYTEGPLLLTLTEGGTHNFICDMLNYCSMGMKFTMDVNWRTANSTLPATVP